MAAVREELAEIDLARDSIARSCGSRRQVGPSAGAAAERGRGGVDDCDHVVFDVTPLMRLQDAAWTHVIVVTLPEVTRVSQAAALQDGTGAT